MADRQDWLEAASVDFLGYPLDPLALSDFWLTAKPTADGGAIKRLGMRGSSLPLAPCTSLRR